MKRAGEWWGGIIAGGAAAALAVSAWSAGETQEPAPAVDMTTKVCSNGGAPHTYTMGFGMDFRVAAEQQVTAAAGKPLTHEQLQTLTQSYLVRIVPWLIEQPGVTPNLATIPAETKLSYPAACVAITEQGALVVVAN